MLKELSEFNEEAKPAPTPPAVRRSTGVDGSPSPPTSRSRGTKSKGKHFPTSLGKSQCLPLTTMHSDSSASARVSAEPEGSGNDGNHSPSPSPSKQKHRTVGRATDMVVAEDLDLDAPCASLSKLRGGRLGLVDMDRNDRTSPVQQNKTTTQVPDVCSPLSELHTEGRDKEVLGSSHCRGLSTASNSSVGPPPLPAPQFGAPAGPEDDDDDLQPAPLVRKGFSQLFGTAPSRSLTFGESLKKSLMVSPTVQCLRQFSDCPSTEGRVQHFP